MIEYLKIVLGVVIFGIQHSGLSAYPIKYRIIDRWSKRVYSLIFNLTSILSLAASFLLIGFWDWLYFITSPESIQLPLAILGSILILLGLIIAGKASQVISVSTVADMRTDRKPQLVTGGIYSRIRHPLYLATILLFLGLICLYPFPQVAVFSGSMIGYILVGSYLEERKLVLQYGQEYLDYRKKAGFILPRLRKPE